jgi:hypothetical protein
VTTVAVPFRPLFKAAKTVAITAVVKLAVAKTAVAKTAATTVAARTAVVKLAARTAAITVLKSGRIKTKKKETEKIRSFLFCRRECVERTK